MTTLTNNADLIAGLKDINTSVTKTSTDLTAVLAKVSELEAALILAKEVPAGVQTAFDSLKVTADAAAGLVPVAPVAQ